MKCLACGKEKRIYDCNVCKKCYDKDKRVELIEGGREKEHEQTTWNYKEF